MNVNKNKIGEYIHHIRYERSVLNITPRDMRCQMFCVITFDRYVNAEKSKNTCSLKQTVNGENTRNMAHFTIDRN